MSQQTEPSPHVAGAPILFVDLDGTLVQTDILFELLFALLRRQPWCLALVPFWLLKGRAGLKTEVARRIGPTPSELPFNPELLGILERRRADGCRLVLATASPRPWAEAVAAHLGVFDAVLATDPGRNLKGAGKLAAIRAYCAEAGYERFDYAGDAEADLPIWRESHRALVVGPDPGLARRLSSSAPSVAIEPIGPPRRPWRALLKALRPHQWSKNALIFVPVITGQRLSDPAAMAAASAAFAAFCLCASAIYVVNDLVDLAADRAHHEKRRRPFASGALPLAWGPPMAVGLLLAALGLSAAVLPARFLAVLAAYLVITTLYSLVIKSRLMVDVLTLALLYALRILAGGVATSISISEWLIGFSLFFFLSLAFVKRHSELHRAISVGNMEKLQGRGYRPGDIGLIESLGGASGYLAVLVLALYIQSDVVQSIYRSPEWLWGISLVLIYWISRIWFLTKRGELPGDPVSFALRDRHSQGAGLIV
ncbi:MAG: UbiA family prenyltransferase, partial [Thermoleophilia bacterium]|nr:UbiA family prenyltransferase [Thermoleophilia bacterium]